MSAVEGTSSTPAPTGGLTRRVTAHPLAAFFVITFTITWVWELLVFGLLDLEFVPWSIPGTFAPAVAAVVVTGMLDGK